MIYAKKPAWYIIVMAVPGLLWVNISRGSTPTRGDTLGKSYFSEPARLVGLVTSIW